MSLESLIEQIKKDGQAEKAALQAELQTKMQDHNEKRNISFQKLKKETEADYLEKERIIQSQMKTTADFHLRMRQLVLKEALFKEAIEKAKENLLASDCKEKILEKEFNQYKDAISDKAVIRSSMPLSFINNYKQVDLGWSGLVIEDKGTTIEINLDKLVDELVSKNSKEYINILFS